MVVDPAGGGPSRRTVLRTLGAGALGGAGVLGATGSTTADPSSEHFHNPVGPVGFGDVTAVRGDDGAYYVYGTETPQDIVPIARSTDMVNWTYRDAVFDSPPSWRSNPDAGVWAPDVTRYNGRYHIYYSYSTWGSQNNPGIGLATADDPLGPWTDQGPVFRAEDLGMTNAIDADFHVVDGTPYLIWGSWYGIYAVELTPDGADYVPGTAVHLAGDRKEGPTIMEANGYYYLFYATGVCCEGADSTYAVAVGRSDSITGPYYNQNGTDLRDLNTHHAGPLVLEGTSQFIGPGHNDTIRDPAGNAWMLYHTEATDQREVRQMMLDRIRWTDDDWPVVGCDGTPCARSDVVPTMEPSTPTATPTDTATPTATATPTPCQPTAITPYLRVDGGSWQNTASVTIGSGSSVEFGPQPTSGGSWAWSGPGLSATGREVTVSPSSAGTATYTATYTNDCGATSTQSFTVTVESSTPTDTATPTPEGCTDPAAPAWSNGTTPYDVDGDGVHEDFNGNCEFDSDDVVTYFQEIDRDEIQSNPTYYDANGNGNADFDDVVTLFQQL